MKNTSEAKPAENVPLSKLECQRFLASYDSELDYLNEKIASDQPHCLVCGINVIAKAHGMSKLAKKTGISRDGLYKAFSTTGNPSLITVMRVLKGLGYQLKTIASK